MRCDDVENVLMRFVDGRLEPPTAEAVEGHLEICPRCRKLYVDEVEWVDTFRPLRETGAAEDVVAEVMKVARQPAEAPAFPFRPPWRAAAGMAALGVGLLLWVGADPAVALPSADLSSLWASGLGLLDSLSGYLGAGWEMLVSLHPRLGLDESLGSALPATLGVALWCAVLVLLARARIAKEQQS